MLEQENLVDKFSKKANAESQMRKSRQNFMSMKNLDLEGLIEQSNQDYQDMLM